MTWGRRNPELVDAVFPEWNGGSSGLFAIGVTLDKLGVDAVLCGVPMDETPHILDGKPWLHAGNFRKMWERRHDRMRNHVRSMSGWTRQLLGPPTREWLLDRMV